MQAAMDVAYGKYSQMQKLIIDQYADNWSSC